MFNVRPNLRVPGFNVREPEEVEPGFRLNADGTIGKAPMTAAKPDGIPFDIFEPGCLATAVPGLHERTRRQLSRAADCERPVLSFPARCRRRQPE